MPYFRSCEGNFGGPSLILRVGDVLRLNGKDVEVVGKADEGEGLA